MSEPTAWSIWLSSVKVAVVQMPSCFKKKYYKNKKNLQTKNWARGVTANRDAENTLQYRATSVQKKKQIIPIQLVFRRI